MAGCGFLVYVYRQIRTQKISNACAGPRSNIHLLFSQSKLLRHPPQSLSINLAREFPSNPLNITCSLKDFKYNNQNINSETNLKVTDPL